MTKAIHIVADENIPGLLEILPETSSLTLLPGREITNKDLLAADVLLVRSVTKVNQELLEGTPIRFVGTCTIGEDHIDLEYLYSQGIQFTSAPGCNANAVVDYVITAMLFYKPMLHWLDKTVGIIGYGQVGSRLHRRLQQIGIQTLLCDPYKEEAEASLADVLHCDVITCHVPLTDKLKDANHPTLHLLGEEELLQIHPEALLINTSRGPVIDNKILLQSLKTGRFKCVLDVFEDEPEPSLALLDSLLISTGHIAGYSIQGKLRGTIQVVEKLYGFLGIDSEVPDLLAPHDLDFVVEGDLDDINQLIQRVYDIEADSRHFRHVYDQAVTDGSAGLGFDAYRKNYAVRSEFGSLKVVGPGDAINDYVKSLGFRQ